jgi:SagB-type dehydrogenase family enzyme
VFRDRHPLSWTYHKNTGRWPHNLQSPAESAAPHAPFKENLGAPTSRLPAPRFPPISLAQAIAGRFSCRRFTSDALDLNDLATLLAAAYGIRGRAQFGEQEFLERPVPSGGGLYPLELYILARNVAGLATGVFHYAALAHAIEQIRALPLPELFLSELFLGQPYAAAGAAIVVLTAVLERSLWKYGDRGYRYILFEAGHVAQNLNLTATALGLGSCNLAGFFDTDLAALLAVDEELEIPLYAVALGNPAHGTTIELRQPPAWSALASEGELPLSGDQPPRSS